MRIFGFFGSGLTYFSFVLKCIFEQDSSASLHPHPDINLAGSRASSSNWIKAPGTPGMVSSRRGSMISVGSSGGFSKARSFLSNYGEHSTGPVLEGDIHVVSGIDCGDQIINIEHNENESILAAGLVSGQIKIFNPSNGNLLQTLEATDATGSPFLPISRIRCKPFTEGTPNNFLASTYVSGHLRIWNTSSGQCVSEVQDENKSREYLCLSHNPFVDVIAVGVDDGNIKLFDEKTMQVVSLLQKSLSPSKVNGHTDRVLCICNHPTNPHEFVSSGWDNTLQIWDARSPNAVRSIYGAFVCGEGLTFEKRGKELMIASWRPENSLQIIDYSSGNIINDIEPQASPNFKTCAQYIGKDYIVSGSTNKGQIRIYDRQKKARVATVSEIPNVYDIDVSKKGQVSSTHGALKFCVTSNNNIVTIELKK